MSASSRFDVPVLTPLQMLLATLGLVGFAIVQPLLSILGENPILFTFNNVDGANLVLFAVGLVIVPTLVCWLPAVLTSFFSALAGWWVHFVVMVVLFLLAAIQWVTALGVDGTWARILSAAVLTGAFGIGYRRFDQLRAGARFTSVLPVAAALLFLFASPTGDLLDQPSLATAGADDDIERPDVFLLLLDQLPTRSMLDASGGIDSTRFPNLANFAESATWYRQHTTLAPATEFAVPAILTGADPLPTAPLWSDYPDNLFTMLAGTHRLVVSETATKLCGIPQCSQGGGAVGSGRSEAAELGPVVDQTWELWLDRVRADQDPVFTTDEFAEDLETDAVDDPVAPSTSTAADAARLADLFDPATTGLKPVRLREFADAVADTTDPTLYFLHLVLPHRPWHLYQDGLLYTPPAVTDDHYPYSPDNDLGDWIATLSEQRHLLQAEYTDVLVGEFLDSIHDAGLFDDSLVVIMADHGISLVPGTHHGEMSEETLSSMAYSPLLIKYPGQADGEISDRNVMSVDVVPTIADVTSVIPTWPIGGQSLLDGDERSAAKYTYAIEGGGFFKKLGERIEFSASRYAPKSAERWVGAVGLDEDRLMASHRVAGVDHLIGRSFDEVVVARNGTVVVDQLDALLDHDPSQPQPGVIQGAVDGLDPSGPVVVAVNGTIVTGSPQFVLGDRERAFTAMLPSRSLSGQDTIRLGVVTADGVVELDVRES